MTTDNAHNDLANLRRDWDSMASSINLMSIAIRFSGTDNEQDRMEEAVDRIKENHNNALKAVRLLENALRDGSSQEIVAKLRDNVRMADHNMRACFTLVRITIERIATPYERRR